MILSNMHTVYLTEEILRRYSTTDKLETQFQNVSTVTVREKLGTKYLTGTCNVKVSTFQPRMLIDHVSLGFISVTV